MKEKQETLTSNMAVSMTQSMKDKIFDICAKQNRAPAAVIRMLLERDLANGDFKKFARNPK